jgi:hypothetical protein
MNSTWKTLLSAAILLAISSSASPQQSSPWRDLNDKDYFEMPGLNVMSFQDIYSEGFEPR